jgi:hypothetical protein
MTQEFKSRFKVPRDLKVINIYLYNIIHYGYSGTETYTASNEDAEERIDRLRNKEILIVN